MSVPSSEIRALDNPAILWNSGNRLWRWNTVVWFHPMAKNKRAVFDVQISTGWMHSGYPFMAHHSASGAIDLSHMIEGDWGMFHELGHNHQWMPSTLLELRLDVISLVFT